VPSVKQAKLGLSLRSLMYSCFTRFILRATFQPLPPFSKKKGLPRQTEIPLRIVKVPKGGLEPLRVSPPRLKKVKDFVWRRRKDDYVKLPQTAECDYSHKE